MEGRRFIVTTVIRGAPLDAVSGMVYVVDADARRALMASPIPETPWGHAGTNPRGGHRGGRGIAVNDGRLAIANADEIHLFDRAWRRVQVLGHPLLGDIHELAPVPEGFLVCSTRSDTLIGLGWDGAVRDTWSWRFDPALVARFGYRAVAPLDESLDYRDMRQVSTQIDLSHLNGVRVLDDGLLISLGRVRLPTPSGPERVYAAAGAIAHAALIGRPFMRRLRAERVRRFGADPQPGSGRRGLVVHVRSGRRDGGGRGSLAAQVAQPQCAPSGRRLVLRHVARLVVARHRDTGAERVVAVPQASGFPRGLACAGGRPLLVGTRRPPRCTWSTSRRRHRARAGAGGRVAASRCTTSSRYPARGTYRRHTRRSRRRLLQELTVDPLDPQHIFLEPEDGSMAYLVPATPFSLSQIAIGQRRATRP